MAGIQIAPHPRYSVVKNKKVRYWVTYKMPDGKQRREAVGKFTDLDPYSIDDAREAETKPMVQKAENR